MPIEYWETILKLNQAHQPPRSSTWYLIVRMLSRKLQGLTQMVLLNVGEAAGSRYHRNHECHKGLSRRDGVGTVVGEGHQAADLPSQTDSLEESDEADKATEGGDGLGGGSEPDLPSGEDGVTRILHRLVKGHELWLFDTTLLPHDL